jgi:hypothetical protein
MIQLTPQMRLLVALAPVDFRRGIDGLCRLCREVLTSDPFSGTVFVFRNQRGESFTFHIQNETGDDRVSLAPPLRTTGDRGSTCARRRVRPR